MCNERDDIITLVDEDGKESKFQYLALVELRDKEYVVLQPLDEGSAEDEVVIFLFEPNEDEELFFGIEDENELNEVFEQFKLLMESENAEILDESSNVITLVDDEGNEKHFQYVDTVDLDDVEYDILLTLDESADCSNPQKLAIFRVEEDDEEEPVYTEVEDENEFNEVFARFKLQQEEDEKDE